MSIAHVNDWSHTYCICLERILKQEKIIPMIIQTRPMISSLGSSSQLSVANVGIHFKVPSAFATNADESISCIND